MDVNNTPYFLLRSEAELAEGSRRLQWHAGRQALTLAQNQSLRLPASDAVAALAAWQAATPMAVDTHYQVARLGADARSVEFNSGRGWLPLKDGELNSLSAPAGTLRDLNLNREGRLAVPFSDDIDQHGLLLFHLRQRWLTRCALPVAPRRAWVDADDRVWCIGADRLMLCQGEPLPLPYAPRDDRFEPLTPNPEALGLRWQQPLPSGWEALALCGDRERLYVLVHDGAGSQRILVRSRSTVSDRPYQSYAMGGDVPFAIDLEMAGPGRLAALTPRQADDTPFRQRDCPVLGLQRDAGSDVGEARLILERYPMLSLAVPRFASSADGQLRYQAKPDADYPDVDPRPRELHALRQPRYHLEAAALLQEVLDSGAPNTIWHRVYLDACIPPGCAIRLSARVYDTPEQRGSAELIEQPVPVWNPLPSELAFQQALSGHEPGQRGLFELLLQRPSGPVRRLTGRYLQLRVGLRGTGRSTPSLHAIRVYQPRFSYQEAYLPELYRQELSYDPANDSGPANGADTRERLLASFEGVLTPIEGRIAASDQLLHPDAAPRQNLHWLARSIGADLPAHWPLARQRRWLKQVTLIQQYKGTLPAANLALDILTDGGVQRGDVVVLENFRLRRTMATILGRHLDDADHPLTLGTGMSGNSIVGDSLILSDMNAREFLAMFAPELATEEEALAVEAFFERYGHRLSVLLHGPARQQRNAVEEMLRQQLPAHLQWRIIETERPFILGTSPLLSVDTYLERQPDAEPVILDETRIGQDGLLHNPVAFSPRDINAGARRGDEP
ncbi:phage tail protein [Halomonas aestuarii]|uniref:Phage tail protein n=1 Tax=Halomonas aestuarii TaxID=1897729 RepID=A0A1J0VCK2_9GAMM|nr:phage tail protein [Halomonas aestuarii]APE29735.1 phage tail protein [Halomonas aestuarii]